MKIEVCLKYFVLSRVYAMKFEVCQEWFMLLSRVYVINFEVCQQFFCYCPVFMYWRLRYVRSVLCY